MDKLKIIQELRRPMCTACELHKSAGNVCVMGRGSVEASIMLIGEAPGQAEAETGKPFMGESGQRLQAIIDSLGMTEDVYITNVCKCRPPKNRTPTKDERKTCGIRYLDFEIKVIHPKVIITLGKTAEWYFSPGGRLDKATWYMLKRPLPEVRLICTWHPAYGLRAGDWVFEDIKQTLIKAKEQLLM